MLNTLFRGHWLVQVLFAALAFAAAGFLYLTHQEREAEKVLALQQGVPAAVSLNAFDPAKDIHPADEVHVIGWINTEYNYELTETSRKRSDVVRRMFVMFGPEDTAQTKTARAVILMPQYDVDRFIEGLMANTSGLADGGNPVFALNGTAESSPTLDNMANDALKEKGLTKAPGFQFIEIWPHDGRAAALAPDPTTGLIVAGGVAAFGLLLLLVGVVKYRRRNAKPALMPAAPVTKPWGADSGTIAETPLSAPVSNAAVDAALAARPKRGLPVEPSSYAFLGIAIAIGVASTWVGSWQLMVLAFIMGGWHFAARVKRAMDKGVTAVASTLSALKEPSSAESASGPGVPPGVPSVSSTLAALRQMDARGGNPAPSQSAVESVPSLSSRVSGLSRIGGGKPAQYAGALVVLMAIYLVAGKTGFLEAGLPTISVSAEGSGTGGGPVAAPAPAPTTKTAEVSPVAAAPEAAQAVAAPEPPVPAAAATPVQVVENPLIPETASLRPKAGEAGAVVTAAVPAAAPEPIVTPEPAPAVAPWWPMPPRPMPRRPWRRRSPLNRQGCPLPKLPWLPQEPRPKTLRPRQQMIRRPRSWRALALETCCSLRPLPGPSCWLSPPSR